MSNLIADELVVKFTADAKDVALKEEIVDVIRILTISQCFEFHELPHIRTMGSHVLQVLQTECGWKNKFRTDEDHGFRRHYLIGFYKRDLSQLNTSGRMRSRTIKKY